MNSKRKNNPARVQNYHIRNREALVLFGDFSNLQEELDLHILSLDLKYDPFTRQVLSDGLSAMGLHLATRPPDEHVGWTVNLQSPLMNLFFVGNSTDESIIARAFLNEDEVEVRERNLLICQSKREHGAQHQSFIEFQGVDLFSMVEGFYRDSEQTLGRFFHRDSTVALIKGLPDADDAWIRSVSAEQVFALPKSDAVQFLEERTFRFRCGCDKEKIAGTLLAVYGHQVEEIFGDDDVVEVDCPRCGSRVTLTREGYTRRLAEAPDDETP